MVRGKDRRVELGYSLALQYRRWIFFSTKVSNFLCQEDYLPLQEQKQQTQPRPKRVNFGNFKDFINEINIYVDRRDENIFISHRNIWSMCRWHTSRYDLTVKTKNLSLPPVTLRSLTTPLARDERQRISLGLSTIKSRVYHQFVTSPSPPLVMRSTPVLVIIQM